MTPSHLIDLCDVLGVDPDAAAHITIDRDGDAVVTAPPFAVTVDVWRPVCHALDLDPDGVTRIEVTPRLVAWAEWDPDHGTVHHRERPVRDPETADGG